MIRWDRTTNNIFYLNIYDLVKYLKIIFFYSKIFEKGDVSHFIELIFPENFRFKYLFSSVEYFFVFSKKYMFGKKI